MTPLQPFLNFTNVKPNTYKNIINLLLGLLSLVSMDIVPPLSCACIASTPNTVHQNEEDRSHLYKWKIHSKDLISMLLPELLENKREYGSRSRDCTINTGDRHKQYIDNCRRCVYQTN